MALLSTMLLVALLPAGSINAVVTLPVCLGITLAGVVHLSSSRAAWPTAGWVPMALAGVALLQLIPWPLSALELAAPAVADVWSRTATTFGTAITWAPPTLAPDATALEALGWLANAAVFWVAFRASRHSQSVEPVAAVGFGAGLVGSAVIGAHIVFRADSLYGFWTVPSKRAAWGMAPIVNPNAMGGYLLLAAFCGLALAVGRKQLVPKPLSIAGTIILIAAGLMQNSRGALGALVLGVACVVALFAVRYGIRSTSAMVPAFALVAGLGAASLSPGLFAGMASEGLEKFGMHRATLQLIWASPWLGVGAGAFEGPYELFSPLPAHIVAQHAECWPLELATDFGVPVAVVAALALAWSSRAALTVRDGRTPRAVIMIGLAAFAIQNLVDLGLEVPALALLAWALLGACVGSAGEPQLQRRRWLRRLVAIGLAGVVGAAAVVFAQPDVMATRRALFQRVKAVPGSDRSAAALVAADLRSAALRRPSEPYFPVLAAMNTSRTGDSPVRFIGRAVELAPRQGRPHLLLAHWLWRRGVIHQALLEFRLAIEHEPRLADEVGKLATVELHASVEQLERAAPLGPHGARMLVTAALNSPSALGRTRLLEAALSRDSKQVEALKLLSEGVLNRLEAGPTDCRSAPNECESVERWVRQLEATSAPSSVVFRGRLLALRGASEEAIRLLDDRCPDSASPAECLRALVRFQLRQRQYDSARGSAQRYLNAACDNQEHCASAAEWCAAEFVQQGLATGAIDYLEQAAREVPTSERWLKVAELAHSNGLHTRAERARQRAAALTP